MVSQWQSPPFRSGGPGEDGFRICTYDDIYHNLHSSSKRKHINDIDNIPISYVQGFKQLAQPWYTDQVLPFDVTIACANEYGAAASAKLFGVEILNEGFGTSVDDSVIEQQATFVARSVEPLQAVANVSLV